MITKEIIQSEIEHFIQNYPLPEDFSLIWEKPLTGYADAKLPYWEKLKELVHPEHDHPLEILPDATVVLSYFIPFSQNIAASNGLPGLASLEWARAYEITNAMFPRLNQHMIQFISRHGYRAAVSKQSGFFDRENITSRWSFRHIAFMAGLGTFGLNNMLITEKGCCGRLNAIVTNLPFPADSPLTSENCLYKASGLCMACVRNCPSGALTVSGFDRKLCFGQCLKNASLYTQFGSSYTEKDSADSGSEVCGKCLTPLPCTFRNPFHAK